MKFNYKLKRLCGAYYGHPTSTMSSSSIDNGRGWNGSNIIFDSTGERLFCGVSNRIQIINLRSSTLYSSYDDDDNNDDDVDDDDEDVSDDSIRDKEEEEEYDEQNNAKKENGGNTSSKNKKKKLSRGTRGRRHHHHRHRDRMIDDASVRTLPIECRSNVKLLALSSSRNNNNNLLVVVDVMDYAMIINVSRGIVLHRFRIGQHNNNNNNMGGGQVRDVTFDPLLGTRIAFAVGKHVQVWNAPAFYSNHCTTTPTTSATSTGGIVVVVDDDKQFQPLYLHRTYTGLGDDVTCTAWSSDSTVLLAGSRDCTIRIWTVDTIYNYKPRSLVGGHKRKIIGLYVIEDDNDTNYNEDNHNIHQVDDHYHNRRRLGNGHGRIQYCYSISEECALVTWICQYDGINNAVGGSRNSSRGRSHKRVGDHMDDIDGIPTDDDDDDDEDQDGGYGTNFFADHDDDDRYDNTRMKSQAHALVYGKWKLQSRHFFQQDIRTRITSTSYCSHSHILAVSFSTGLFGLYEMPSVSNIHTLSVGGGISGIAGISDCLIRSCTLNQNGDWLALGCPTTQQLLVWEWRSETYVIKQRGHAYGMIRCMSYSPDSTIIATGGEDGKIKLWNTNTGFCYVTMERIHTAPITGIVFANTSVVITSSLDGTVCAHDLHRYRTFKTMTSTTKAVQFMCVAVDPSGEIIAAGSMDPFHIYIWNLQTGKILDVLTGHTGPISSIAFPPVGCAAGGGGNGGGGALVSSSWDGTAKIWNLYQTSGSHIPTESLQHISDIVCVTYRPTDGQEICTSCVDGMLSFWDIHDGKLLYEINGRRDIVGGRKFNDRMTSNNNAASKYYTSLCYNALGSCIIAGGNTKFVCIYEISQQILLKKFQVTYNRSFDGVLDELNSKNMGDGGPIDDHVNSDDDDDDAFRGGPSSTSLLPGAKRGDDGSRRSRVEVLTRQVSFSSTGREFAVISGEGLHIYSLDDEMIFDPVALSESVTPHAVRMKSKNGDHCLALLMALHLNEFHIIRHVLDATPYDTISTVVQNLGSTTTTTTGTGKKKQNQYHHHHHHLERFIQYLARIIQDTVHIEFYVEWCLQVLKQHGSLMEKDRSKYMRAFRIMYKSISSTAHNELRSICDDNQYSLDYIIHHHERNNKRQLLSAAASDLVDDDNDDVDGQDVIKKKKKTKSR